MIFFNHFTFSALITSITTLFLGIFVLLNNRWKERLYLTFAIYSFVIALWSFCVSRFSPTFRDPYLIWGKLLHLGAILIPVFFIHFIHEFLHLKNKIVVMTCYLMGTSFIILNFFTNLLINGTTNKEFYSFPTPGPIYPYMFIFFIIFTIYAITQLFKAFLVSSGSSRNQLKYLLFSSIVGYIGGMKNFAILIGREPPIIYPYGTYAIPLYTLVVAYAIIRHQLLEIEVIIKKTLVFASLFAIAFGIFVGITVLTQELIAGGRLLGLAISSIIIIFSVRPLEDFLIQITDKYLFQKKYDYRHLVNKFMEDLRTMALNTKDIAQSTVEFIRTSIRPTESVILVYNKFKSRYDIVASHGFKRQNFILANDSPIIRELIEFAKTIRLDNINNINTNEKKQLYDLGIKLVIPLLIHKELLGILMFGQKKSDEEYTGEDIEVLRGLSGTLSIALNNAQLFDERAEAEKRALVGTLATGINHEIGNPLNIMRIKFDSYRILKKEGFYKNKSKEELMQVVDDIANACTSSIDRIGGIARQIAEFAKPDKSLVFAKVDVKESISKIITILKHGMIEGADRIRIEVAPDSLYSIVDRGQFEQILFNLLKNACDAIDKEKGTIIIKAMQISADEIRLEVSDNGHGIPDDAKEKIFMPFFTTRELGRGTGLGLTLTKIMVEKNDGKIMVESTEGKGTTFIILLRGGV